MNSSTTYRFYVQAEHEYVREESLRSLVSEYLPGFIIFTAKDSDDKRCYIIEYVSSQGDYAIVIDCEKALRHYAQQTCVMLTRIESITRCTCSTVASRETPAQRAEWLLSMRFPTSHQGE